MSWERWFPPMAAGTGAFAAIMGAAHAFDILHTGTEFSPVLAWFGVAMGSLALAIATLVDLRTRDTEADA